VAGEEKLVVCSLKRWVAGEEKLVVCPLKRWVVELEVIWPCSSQEMVRERQGGLWKGARAGFELVHASEDTRCSEAAIWREGARVATSKLVSSSQ
jgi:hypothetical protein